MIYEYDLFIFLYIYSICVVLKKIISQTTVKKYLKKGKRKT